MSDFLQTAQADVFGRLLAAEDLATVPVLLQRALLDEAAVKRRMGALDSRTGRTGACVIVLMPEISVPSTEAPGPTLIVRQSCLVLEHPTVNHGDVGTGLSAEQIAVFALQALHHFRASGTVQTFTAGSRAIVPDATYEGLVGYLVTVEAYAGVSTSPKLPTPSITGTTGPITAALACDDAAAELWYTLDGTYPWSGNPAAMAYAAPFLITTACTLRAVAYRTGYQASNVASAVISL